MQNKLNNKFLWVKNTEIQNLIKALSYKNHIFAFVGGCVRDSLLNLPVNDIDIASSFTPEENMAILTQLGYVVVASGLKYGTITLVLNNTNYEITSLRADITTNGRHAEVKFTNNFKIDALRRDFTINALYLNPHTLEITDYFNGLNDLENGNLVFIGNANSRINEDYLRILRYFRFLKLLKNSLNKPLNNNEDILKSLEENSNKINLLSNERIYNELFKIITQNNSNINAKVLEHILLLMDKTCVLKQLFNNNYVINNIKNITLLLNNLSNFNINNNNDIFNTVLAFILHNTLTNSFLNVNSSLEKINNIIELKLLIAKLHLSEMFDFVNLAINFGFNETIKALLCIAFSNKNLENNYINIAKKLLQKQKLVFPVNGNDLINIGVAEGKEIGVYLKQLQQKFYNNPSLTKTDLLNLVKK